MKITHIYTYIYIYIYIYGERERERERERDGYIEVRMEGAMPIRQLISLGLDNPGLGEFMGCRDAGV